MSDSKEFKINVDPDAWATTDKCVGPTYGKVRYDKMPIQSLAPLRYAHEKLFLESTVIGLMKAAYYDGYTESGACMEAMDELVDAAMGYDGHDSDCATHNEPAYPNEDCNCSKSAIVRAAAEIGKQKE